MIRMCGTPIATHASLRPSVQGTPISALIPVGCAADVRHAEPLLRPGQVNEPISRPCTRHGEPRSTSQRPGHIAELIARIAAGRTVPGEETRDVAIAEAKGRPVHRSRPAAGRRGVLRELQAASGPRSRSASSCNPLRQIMSCVPASGLQ